MDFATKLNLLKLLHLNRAQAYLSHGDHHVQAIEDVMKVLEIDPNHLKGLFRLAMGHYEGRDWSSAESAAKKLAKVVKSDKAPDSDIQKAQELLHRITTRVKEQTLGEYDFAALHKQLQGQDWTMRIKLYDIADYISKSVTSIDTKGNNGCSLRSNKAIKAGDLIMLCKALHVETVDASTINTTYKDQTKGTFHLGAQLPMLAGVMTKLSRDVKTAEKFLGLCKGSYSLDSLDNHKLRIVDPVPEDYPVIDRYAYPQLYFIHDCRSG